MLKYSILALCFGTQALAGTVKGSGKIAEESRKIDSFDEVSVAAGMHATVTPGTDHALTIKGDDNILPLVETHVTGNSLEIRMKRGSSIRTSTPIELSITAPAVKKLSASGGSHLSSSASSQESFSVSSSGGSHVSLKDLNVKDLNIDASGGSHVKAEGKASHLKFDGSGGARLQADSLQVDKADVSASGGTQVHVKSAAKIKGDISGGARIFAIKSAEVEVSKSGGAALVKE